MNDAHGSGNGFFRSRSNLVLIAFLLIGGFFVVVEHRVHAIEWLPFLLLAACPLLHLFHGHGAHGGHGKHDARPADGERKEP
ncbi:MAG: hypothetical protein A2Z64_13030 [Betaproteobacteria bacterium RIFCSPLOWO2_02_67_12]|nr:MAG: hypothetical protein A2Z64_13030 [Betaproteobacteria bacterium RIFCSPLOWO2_02_67_12]OGA31059.1 MAG: hypothetical protein A3I65_08665 [Betaproteobacteria bacterium RIFCSPLOWO2_02_FULL_68_150]OGA70479.1 MAG: hypothetical protein A3F77_07955 [Betaproteobacteria bacterium RIFCSPLOWO2_12_FULL_67_28]